MRWEFRLLIKRGRRKNEEFIFPIDSHTREQAYSRVFAALHILMTNFEVLHTSSRKAGEFNWTRHDVVEAV